MMANGQTEMDLSDVCALHLSPRKLGRLAARQGKYIDTNPYREHSTEWEEWKCGWGLVHGIPDTIEGQAEFLRVSYLRFYDALLMIRDDPTIPVHARDLARRTLTGDDDTGPAEAREG